MKPDFSNGGLSKTVEFPKTLLAVEYVISSKNHNFFYSKYGTYQTEADLLEQAYENRELLKEQNFSLVSVLIVPLVFDTIKPQKKSYWPNFPKGYKSNYLFFRQEMIANLLENYQNHKAVVCCSFYHPEGQLISCAGYYSSLDKNQPTKCITETPCEADEQVKNFALYDVIKPYVIPLDPNRNQMTN